MQSLKLYTKASESVDASATVASGDLTSQYSVKLRSAVEGTVPLWPFAKDDVYFVLFAPGQVLSGVYVGVAAEYVDCVGEAAELGRLCQLKIWKA